MNLKSLAIKNSSDSDEVKTAYIEFEGEGVDIFGDGYQKAMDDFDIVMKSPGVVLEYTPNAEILSQVELFLHIFFG